MIPSQNYQANHSTGNATNSSSSSGSTSNDGGSGTQPMPGEPDVVAQPTIVAEYFYNVDTSHLLHMIADMLYRLTIHNDKIPLTSSSLSRFHSRAAPGISISDYLRRIIKYAAVEKVCLLILLIYIDRVCESHRSFTISTLTVHRFVITAICISSKALSDSYCSNGFYAKVGGISTKELNNLELELLFLIDWKLVCEFDVLQQYYVNLVKQHPGYQRSVTHESPVLSFTGPRATTSVSSINQHSHKLNTSHSVAHNALSRPSGNKLNTSISSTHLPPISSTDTTLSKANAIKIPHEAPAVTLPSV